MRARRGITLVETLVVISTASVVMTLATTTIIWLLRTEGSGADALIANTSLARLAADFRHDVRNATDAKLTSADDSNITSLVLALPDASSVRYEASSGKVSRKQKMKTALRVESYSVGSGENRFDIIHPENRSGSVHTPTFVRMVHARTLSPKTTGLDEFGAVREYRIDAQLARDHRFAVSATTVGGGQ
jgi:Tfp pilus assembly protein FimT